MAPLSDPCGNRYSCKTDWRSLSHIAIGLHHPVREQNIPDRDLPKKELSQPGFILQEGAAFASLLRDPGGLYGKDGASHMGCGRVIFLPLCHHTTFCHSPLLHDLLLAHRSERGHRLENIRNPP